MTAKSRFQGTPDYPEGLVIGIDVGSTTVKAVVVDPADPEGRTLWTDYRRHETRQQEFCLDFLERIGEAFSSTPPNAMRVFTTGTGGATLAQNVGGYFVQEVNALCLVVSKRFPRVRSVIELGGEDAKIIVFKTDAATAIRRKSASMNDKCAGGTGAVIDKISSKLRIEPARVGEMRYDGLRVHPVAGKCGVFAETDINGLQKQGVPAEELMASLFESLIRQNLSVLARGNTLYPDVLLLGGPNTFIRGMQECWRRHLPLIWEEREVPIPAGARPEDFIHVPQDALLFAALGAVEYARAEIAENREIGVYQGADGLRWYLEEGRTVHRRRPGVQVRGVAEGFGQLEGLAGTADELRKFRESYRREAWQPPVMPGGSEIEAFLGIDGGSTSTKAVLLDRHKRVLAKSYRLSLGNPIEDMKAVVGELQQQVETGGRRLRIRGSATTGYAKDMLRSVARADVALVETVAHMHSGLLYFPGADVICDVGGQDIKVILLKNGVVKDFRLNTQCSAGNGFYLQSTAAAFGYPVDRYADIAFTAETMPQFSYGCAVFLQTDIVDFQRQGWRPNEILAGLAAVLPKNIWLYVCQMPNVARLGRTFILQGGTQHNLAAVKAQVDFIRSRFEGSGVEPEVVVHPHCGESGAIGCAMEALRIYEDRPYETTFIGLDALQAIRYSTRRDETTRCSFCTNKCMRTFIEVSSEGHDSSKRQIIIANCEKGSVENVADAREIGVRERAVQAANLNLAAICARDVFKPVEVATVADPAPRLPWLALPSFRRAAKRRRALIEGRKNIRIGMPRALNMYLNAPFFTGYFMSLGVPPENLVWSDYTTDSLFKEGAKRGSIDPCFPSKLAIAHIHNLLYRKHGHDHRLTHLFFPVVDTLPTWLHGVMATRACPTSMATIEATHAAFVKETDLFAERGLRFKRTFINLDNARLCARQMYEDWADDLGLSEAESARAVEEGLLALRQYQNARRNEARQALETVQREKRLAIVVLARPYHNDPGINQGILEQFQKRGYPILTHDTLPLEDDIILPLFGAEVAAGEICSPFSIDDVWKNTFAENSSRKLWAAKFVARHPHLVGLELSNFKCGHDAPTYAAIEEIFECSGSPFFYFKDIDENRPAGTIKLRVETISYFLERYGERMAATGFRMSHPVVGRAERARHEAEPLDAVLSAV